MLCAIVKIKQLLQQNEEMHIARFQLGFLFYSINAMDEAREAWQPLIALGAENSLNLFVNGLTKLENDDKARAQLDLETGIKNNQEYLPLDDQIINILQQLEAEKAGSNDMENTRTNDATPLNSVYLSNYS